MTQQAINRIIIAQVSSQRVGERPRGVLDSHNSGAVEMLEERIFEDLQKGFENFTYHFIDLRSPKNRVTVKTMASTM